MFIASDVPGFGLNYLIRLTGLPIRVVYQVIRSLRKSLLCPMQGLPGASNVAPLGVL